LNLSGTGILPVFKITGKMPVPQSCRLFNPHSLVLPYIVMGEDEITVNCGAALKKAL